MELLIARICKISSGSRNDHYIPFDNINATRNMLIHFPTKFAVMPQILFLSHACLQYNLSLLSLKFPV